MAIAAVFFYLFAAVMVASAFMVVAARNPVHSVLYLILCFFNAAGLFLIVGAEFLAMILVVVYVGAVAVLFLFVVMMLDVDFQELRSGALQYLPIGALVGIVLLLELVLVLGSWQSGVLLSDDPIALRTAATPGQSELVTQAEADAVVVPQGPAEALVVDTPARLIVPPREGVSNAEAIGYVLYTRYILFFQLAGLILLVAMIGAIVLTLRHKVGVRRQSIAAQVGRTRAAAGEVVAVETGKGI